MVFHWFVLKYLYLIEGDFAVQLNTSHPEVSAMLIDKFEDATNCIMLDHPFSLEVFTHTYINKEKQCYSKLTLILL